MNEIEQAGYDAYPAYTNPFHARLEAVEFQTWDRGYWQAHDESFVPGDNGIEDGYGDWYDQDAVSQGFYDDDPSPYGGTYSEM